MSDNNSESAFKERSMVTAKSVAWYAITSWSTMLLVGLILEQGAFAAPTALILLFLVPGCMRISRRSQQWLFAFLIYEIAGYVSLFGLLVHWSSIGVSYIGPVELSGLQFYVFLILILFFAAWAFRLANDMWRLVEQHPGKPKSSRFPFFMKIFGVCLIVMNMIALSYGGTFARQVLDDAIVVSPQPQRYQLTALHQGFTGIEQNAAVLASASTTELDWRQLFMPVADLLDDGTYNLVSADFTQQFAVGSLLWVEGDSLELIHHKADLAWLDDKNAIDQYVSDFLSSRGVEPADDAHNEMNTELRSEPQ